MLPVILELENRLGTLGYPVLFEKLALLKALLLEELLKVLRIHGQRGGVQVRLRDEPSVYELVAPQVLQRRVDPVDNVEICVDPLECLHIFGLPRHRRSYCPIKKLVSTEVRSVEYIAKKKANFCVNFFGTHSILSRVLSLGFIKI